MIYNQNLPDDSVNVTKNRPLIYTIKLLVALIFSIGLLYMILSLVLNIIVSNLPLSYEKRLTSLIEFDINITKAHSSKYLDEIVDRLNRCADIPYEINSFIIKDPTPNAFVLPGGTIYITDSMIDKLKSKNELIAVLGHEIGHLKNRDHLKRFGKSIIFSMISLLLGDSYGTVLNTSLNVSSAKFSQSAEFDADIFALDLMQCAYGSVNGAVDLFLRLDKGDDWRYFLATHPSFTKRVDNMNNHILKQGYSKDAEILKLDRDLL